MIEQFKSARRAAVPIVGVETLDQQGTVRMIARQVNGSVPVMVWDIIRGLSPLNSLGGDVIANICSGDDPAIATGNPAEMLGRIVKVPDRTIVFMSNAHRFITNEAVAQGICNLREPYKAIGSTLVLVAPSIVLPDELKQDVMILTEKLPDYKQITAIIQGICNDAGIALPDDIDKIADTLIGLSEFSAEQTLATCIKKIDGEVTIDRKALWERKCKAVEQTPGLSIWRGVETFDDIGGCENIKGFVRSILKGKDSPRAIVFMDEIEKAFAGSSGDTSGVSQDQLGAILTFMQDKEVDGMIFIGPPGAAKSAVAKAAGNDGNVPTVSFDLGAMKNSLVGKSGEQTRQGLSIIEAISQGRAMFIATCNSIAVLPPELRRRFTMGTFFFDLPDKQDRKKIWEIYFNKYKVVAQTIPEDEGWTGAEIKQCAKLSSKLGITLKEAAKFIVPVAKSAADQIETLRRQASGKFISASDSGVYNANVKLEASGGRKILKEE